MRECCVYVVYISIHGMCVRTPTAAGGIEIFVVRVRCNFGTLLYIPNNLFHSTVVLSIATLSTCTRDKNTRGLLSRLFPYQTGDCEFGTSGGWDKSPSIHYIPRRSATVHNVYWAGGEFGIIYS
jgi:hypothetical protein